MDAPATVPPLAGGPADVERRVTEWLGSTEPVALTVRTSGSGGEPKDVALSRTAVTASAAATTSRLGGPGQWVLALPAHYVAGLQVIVRSVLAGTSPVILGDHQDLASAARAISHPRRYLSLVPTQLHRLLAARADVETLAGFDAVLLGGSAARQDLLDEARSRGVRIVTTYGMSETCGGCVYDGEPLDGVSVRIDRDDRVLLAGPMLFDGYVGRPALTAVVLQDGWLHTPDLGRLDDSGRLEILGRVDEVVVSGGVNVSLSAVEGRLLACPGVAQAAVVAVPDEEWGQRVVAVVVPDGSAASPGLVDVRDFIGIALPREWAPRELVTVPTLPMLESGKVDRQSLLRELTSSRD